MTLSTLAERLGLWGGTFCVVGFTDFRIKICIFLRRWSLDYCHWYSYSLALVVLRSDVTKLDELDVLRLGELDVLKLGELDVLKLDKLDVLRLDELTSRLQLHLGPGVFFTECLF